MTVDPPSMKHKLTFDVEGVVDDKHPVPDHGQIHRQVADVIALIRVLKHEAQGDGGGQQQQQQQRIDSRSHDITLISLMKHGTRGQGRGVLHSAAGCWWSRSLWRWKGP